jgi:hypothetical protein
MDNRQITPEMARRELARRELARRGQSDQESNPKQEAIQSINYATGMNRSPFSTLRDVGQGVLTGLGKGGQTIADILTGGYSPKVDMDEMFSSVGSPNKSIGGNVAKGVGEYLPYVYAGGASLPGQLIAGGASGTALTEPGEENFGGFLPSGKIGGAIKGTTLAALPFGASKLINTLKGSTRAGLKNAIIKPHDILEDTASGKFNEVSSKVEDRNIGKFPVKAGFAENLSEYFPRTKAAKKLLSNAESGNYDSLRGVQADLYKRGKDNLTSELEADRLRGEEMLEKRDDINDFISQHLRKSGNEDLANTLDSAIGDWKKLKEIYYHPKMNRAIIKMVDKEHRLVPKNLGGILEEESKPMQQLIDFHPGLDQAISRHMKLKNITKYGLPLAAGALGGGYVASKYRNE